MKRILMRKSVSKMAGITLLETMFAIAVGALILIAAVIFYTTSKQSQNVSKVVTDMQTIVAQTSTYIAPGITAKSSIVVDGNSVLTLQKANYLPSSMNDPWGNEYSATVSIGSGKIVATTDITVTSLKYGDKACAAIAQAVSGSGNKGGRWKSGTTCTFTFDL